MTRTQRALLEEAKRNGGSVPPASVRSRMGGARRRMLERMRDALWVEGPPWRITGLGEDAIADRQADSGVQKR